MFAPSNPPEAHRVVRFGLVGLLNGVLGYAVILIMLRSRAGDIAAKVAGCAVGLTVGFALNMLWTFERSGCDPSALRRYGLAFVIAYAADLAVIAGAGRLGLVENPLVHLVGTAVYSGTLYALDSRLVFASVAGGGSATAPGGADRGRVPADRSRDRASGAADPGHWGAARIRGPRGHENREFRDLFPLYPPAETSGRFTSYGLSGPWARPRNEDCRTVF